MGANSTKLTKDYNHCKQRCIKSILNDLKRGFLEEKLMVPIGNNMKDYNKNNYYNRIVHFGETLTIGCSTCTLKCNNCMYIEVFNSNKKGERPNINVSVYSDSTKKNDFGGKGYMTSEREVYNYILEIYKQVK